MTYSIGIDSGSTATKGILLADGVITRRFLVPTPFRPATAITEAWETLREGLETTPFLTLTGYGRQLVDFADKQVTEISCHGLGARFLEPATRAVIDIGGQDSKVIQLDDDGNLCDFLMNDKCAAGTGRFLEVISRTLGTSVEQLDSITENVIPHAITSMCTVFAESEVISLRSAGVAPEAILAGVINAMARRSANFIARLSCEAPILFTGGVSHCQRFTHMLEPLHTLFPSVCYRPLSARCRRSLPGQLKPLMSMKRSINCAKGKVTVFFPFTTKICWKRRLTTSAYLNLNCSPSAPVTNTEKHFLTSLSHTFRY